jgi:hypothetical protein
MAWYSDLSEKNKDSTNSRIASQNKAAANTSINPLLRQNKLSRENF